MVLKGVRRGSGLSPIHENVKAGTTERLVFSDLVRTSLSRQEDASLLRVILSGKDGLQNQGTRRKALKEVEVRECWRVAREKEILARAKKFGLVSVENAEERRKLADQVASFTRVAKISANDFGHKSQLMGSGTQRRAPRRSPYGGTANARARPSSARPLSSASRVSMTSKTGALTAQTAKVSGPNRGDLRGQDRPRPQRVRPSSAPVARRKTQTESKLMDITQTLLKGLESHKSADGAVQALKALGKNVSEAQNQISILVAAAERKLKGSVVAEGAAVSSGASPSDRFRLHLTKLGYFGSTKADLAIAEHQRARHSALVIQRAARALLARRAAERRALEEAEERKRKEVERKHECARIIQAWFRAQINKRLREESTLETCKRMLAARTIQKHYRYHRLIAIFRKRMAEADLQYHGFGGGNGGSSIPSAWAAAQIIQKWFRMYRVVMTMAAARRRAEGSIERRAAFKSLWREHKASYESTLGAQSYLVFLSFSSGREIAKVMGHVREEEKMFSTSWLKHERKVKRKALHKPLPRNWVPHNDAVTGKIYFINTRTSEAFTTHPNLRAIAPELAMQRERASIAKYTRISVLLKYIDAIEHRSSALQSRVLIDLGSH